MRDGWDLGFLSCPEHLRAKVRTSMWLEAWVMGVERCDHKGQRESEWESQPHRGVSRKGRKLGETNQPGSPSAQRGWRRAVERLYCYRQQAGGEFSLHIPTAGCPLCLHPKYFKRLQSCKKANPFRMRKSHWIHRMCFAPISESIPFHFIFLCIKDQDGFPAWMFRWEFCPVMGAWTTCHFDSLSSLAFSDPMRITKSPLQGPRLSGAGTGQELHQPSSWVVPAAFSLTHPTWITHSSEAGRTMCLVPARWVMLLAPGSPAIPRLTHRPDVGTLVHTTHFSFLFPWDPHSIF